MNSNSRALRLMDQVKARTGLSEEGKNGLIQLINPITDFQTRKVGFAGRADESPSVVFAVKRSVTVTAPPGTTTTWDCHVFNTPSSAVTSPIMHGVESGSNLFYDVTQPNTARVGPFVILKAPAGHPLNLANALADPAVVIDATSLSPDPGAYASSTDVANSYFAGLSSVNGMGFEYHDTTAAISKQGTVTVYALPQPVHDDRYAVDTVLVNNILGPATSSLIGSTSELACYDVPSTITEAMLLDGSRQWEAKFGAYVVPKLNKMEIPIQRLEPVLPVFHSNQFASYAPAYTNYPAEEVVFPGISTIGLSTPAGSSTSIVGLNKLNSFNTSGVFLTGLNPVASLTFNSIMYIERFPNFREQEMVVLASPSPKFDPVMMALYSEIMSVLPVGCKVGDNADGDWFFEGVSAVAKFLRPAFTALGGPIGLAANALGSAADEWAQGKLVERNPAIQPAGTTWATKVAKGPKLVQSGPSAPANFVVVSRPKALTAPPPLPPRLTAAQVNAIMGANKPKKKKRRPPPRK